MSEHEQARSMRAILRTMPDYVWMKSAEGVFLVCNHAFERIFGVTEADIVGKTDHDFIDAELADFFRQKDREAMDAGEMRINEEWVTLADGNRILLETRKMPVYGRSGEVIGILGIGRDITERKRAERELALLSHAVNLTRDAVHIVDNKARIVYANAGMSKVLGYTREELCALTIPEIDPNVSLDSVIATVEGRICKDNPLATDHRDKDGRVFPVEISLDRFEYDGESLLLAVARDVSERKSFEERLALQDRALNQIGEAIYLIDERARILQVNEAASRMLGYSRDELQSMSIADIDPIYNAKVWPHHWADLLRRKNITLETLHRARDGRIIPMEVLANAVEYEGQYLNFALIRDISERKQSEALLRQREREFRTLVENLPIHVVRLDTSLRRSYVNPAFVAGMGLPEEQLVGSHVSQFLRADNMSAEAYAALLQGVLETGVQDEVALEWTDERQQMQSHLLHIAPEYDASNKVSGLLVLGVDITAQHRQQRLEAKRQRIFEMIARDSDLEDALDLIARYTDLARPSLRSVIMMLGNGGTELTGMAAPSFPAQTLEAMTIALTEEPGCCAVAALRGERSQVENLADGKCGSRCRAIASRHGIKSCWSEPVVGSSGQILGVATAFLEHESKPEYADFDQLHQMASLCAIAIERKHIQEQMHRHASYDTLTGLPNRRLFGYRLREEVNKAQRNGQGLALFFIDLDHFKEVNDSLGHEMGDLLLVQASQRIRNGVRESDTVARLGGDEFVVILPEVADLSHLGQLARNLIDALCDPFHLGVHTAYVSASIGIAGFPLDADNADSLIGCADQAMYYAKEQGRNNFSYFTADLQRKVQARLQLSHDLREGIEARQFQLYYQPIVEVATGKVVKAEALLRWKHPERGMVPPDVFIPVCEENGLIHEIGDWVFREAAGVAQRWNTQSLQANPLAEAGASVCQISVNLSPRQFIKGNIDREWLEYCRRLGINPATVSLEITESSLLDDRLYVLEQLARFGSAGMQVALDDFGTGYSAMAYLKKFPIDYLKIDRSFVRDIETDPNDRAIAEAIVVMAHKLGLKVIAEGVETEGQRDILAAVGCEYVQGYLYAKPLPEEEFLRYVGAHSAAHALLMAF